MSSCADTGFEFFEPKMKKPFVLFPNQGGRLSYKFLAFGSFITQVSCYIDHHIRDSLRNRLRSSRFSTRSTTIASTPLIAQFSLKTAKQSTVKSCKLNQPNLCKNFCN